MWPVPGSLDGALYISAVSARPGSETGARVWAVHGSEVTRRADRIATEEPLEIRVVAGRKRRTVAVTMRTPGADFELAAGFLYGEGVVSDRGDVRRIRYCVDRDLDEQQRFNIVNVALASPELPQLSSLERHFLTSSACGVCGKATVESLQMAGCSVLPSGLRVEPEVLFALPDRLRTAQSLFSSTGGLHAAALFDARGELVAAREDVGRHNALDKLVGWAFLQGLVPLHDAIVMVSGRASFEILQKCVRVGAPVLCAVSAPSSLAVQVAQEFDVTLVGFLRPGRFNVYAADQRITKVSDGSSR